jgi:hypothetical protein
MSLLDASPVNVAGRGAGSLLLYEASRQRREQVQEQKQKRNAGVLRSAQNDNVEISAVTAGVLRSAQNDNVKISAVTAKSDGERR